MEILTITSAFSFIKCLICCTLLQNYITTKEENKTKTVNNGDKICKGKLKSIT